MRPVRLALLAVGGLVALVLVTYLMRNGREPTAVATENPVKASTSAPPLASDPTAAATETSPIPPSAPVEGSPVNTPVVAIPVYPEFDRLLSNTRPGRHSKEVVAMHAKLERQARDPAWAAEMENALRNFYLGKPELRRFGINPQVDCRTSDCEVRMVAYGDETTDWVQMLMSGDLERAGSSPWPAGAMAFVTDFDTRGPVTALIINVGFTKRPGFGPPPRDLLK